MKTGLMVLVISLVASACGLADTSATDPDAGPTSEMMAAALAELVAHDHTFGQGPPPFTEYLIQTRIDPSAGTPTGLTGGTARSLTDIERSAIEEAVEAFGPVRWIDDPAEWRTPDLAPTVEGSVILGVGEPVVDGNTGLVPVSLWCSGVCGTWLTYRLDLVDGTWSVTDIEGPVAVS
ncbi:MAG: hypothetical protein ABFR53_06520 [Actinomycetota bacterium]